MTAHTNRSIVSRFALASLGGAAAGVALWEFIHFRTLSRAVALNIMRAEDRTYCLVLGFALLCVTLSFEIYSSRINGSKDFRTALYRIFILLPFTPLLIHRGLFREFGLLSYGVLAIASWNFAAAIAPRAAARSRITLSKWFIPLFSLLWGIYFSLTSIIRHYNFNSRDFDLGVLANVIANTDAGHPFRSSYYHGASFLGVHVSPMYLVLSLGMRFLPPIEYLLVLQSMAVCLAAIPLYYLVLKRTRSDVLAALVSVLYLLHPATHGPLHFDFHELAFLPLALFSFVLSLYGKQRLLTWILFFFVLSIKEDASIITLFTLAGLWGGNLTTRRLAPFVIISTIWYGVSLGLLSYFGGDTHPFTWYYTGLYSDGASGIFSILRTLISNPLYVLYKSGSDQRLVFIMQLLLPAAFLPFASKRAILLLLPGFLLTLLSTEHSELYTISFQYVWYLVPGMFIGWTEVLRAISLRSYRAKSSRIFLARSAMFSCFSGVVLFWQYGSVLNPYFVGGYRVVAQELSEEALVKKQNLAGLEAKIPRDDWVACSSRLCPHIQDHLNVLPCRSWFRDSDAYVKYVLSEDGKECEDQPGSISGFVPIEKRGTFTLAVRQGLN